MPLTRVQYQQRVQQTLADVTGIYFDPIMVVQSIQDGYDEIVTETECVEQVISGIKFVGGQVYYDIYNYLDTTSGHGPKYWKPIRIFNKATNRWLRFVDTRLLDKFRWDWETCSGTPWFCTPIGFQHIAFFPHYAVDTGSFDIFYKVAQDNLTSDSQPVQIPDGYQSVLDQWVVADLLDGIQEFKKAENYWIDYAESLESLKIHVRSRMFPEMYPQLNDLETP